MSKKYHKYKKAIMFFVKIDSLIPPCLNKNLLAFFRGVKGDFGVLIRYILIKNLAKEVGDNVVIKEDVFFDAIHLMSFGDNVSINSYSYIAGEISFGNNVAVANHSSFHSANHSYLDINTPIKYQRIINKPIIISDDVWIAAGCRILSGVHIGTRTVIAAGAVVNKDIPSHCIAGGVPAKIIKLIS